jgi:hypothetical protein
MVHTAPELSTICDAVVGTTVPSGDVVPVDVPPPVVEATVTFTLTVTTDVPLATVNDVEYVPALKADGKLTVTVSLLVPLVGETFTHDTGGGAIDHLSDPFPPFEMLTVCEGTIVPAVPWTLIAVGDTERLPWAETEAGRISAAATSVNNRTAKGRISIGTPVRGIAVN